MKPKDAAEVEAAEVDCLVDELFALVQESQGHFFFSDGETSPTKAQLFERIRGRIAHGKKAVRLMEDFLARHGESR